MSAGMTEEENKRRGLGCGTLALIGVTLGVGLLFMGTIGALAYFASFGDLPANVDVEEGFVRVELAGVLSDAPSQPGLLLDPSEAPAMVTEIAGMIRLAAEDPKVEGLYLFVDGPQMGWGSAQEIRDAIVAFRESGRPSVAYAEALGTAQYYVASAADKVVLAPAGAGFVTGLSASVTYYADTFKMLGVEPEFEHVGDYKSAVEPYERTEPSPEAAEAMNALLDSMYEQVVAGIAEGRGLSSEQVISLLDNPQMSPVGALEQGLVDALAYPDRVRRTLSLLGSEEWASAVADVPDDLPRTKLTSHEDYLTHFRSQGASCDASIAILHADGPILSGEADEGLFAEPALTDRGFAEHMRDIRARDDIHAVVLRVNSPGGSALASDLMWREVERTQSDGTPVVVSMADYAASGGYYISAPADAIVAHPGTVTGSIGVFGGKMNLAGTYDKLGLKETRYKRGALSDLFSSTTAFSDEGRAVYRRFLSDFYDRFIEKVADGRQRTPEDVHEVAQGRVWTGLQAHERGLVDELGGLWTALELAAEIGDVSSACVQRWPQPKTFFELLMEEFGQAEVGLPRVALDVGPVSDDVSELLLLEQILSDGGAAALLPGGLHFD